MKPHDDDGFDLDAAIAALRETRVPPSGERVAERILAEFDRGPGRRARRRRASVWLAAAALILLSLSLVDRAPRSFDTLPSIERRLAELESRVARWTSPPSRPAVVDPAPPPPPGSFAERLRPDFAASGFDPGLLRLVAARRLEGFDDPGAVERYRALVSEYGDSPAAAVARERIRRLAP